MLRGEIDGWAGRNGSTYGTLIVDLERREVVSLKWTQLSGPAAKLEFGRLVCKTERMGGKI